MKAGGRRTTTRDAGYEEMVFAAGSSLGDYVNSTGGERRGARRRAAKGERGEGDERSFLTTHACVREQFGEDVQVLLPSSRVIMKSLSA